MLVKCFSVKDINKFGSWISGSDDNEKLVVFRTITTLATNLKFYQLLAKKKIVIRHWFDFLDKSKANVVVTALKCMLYMMEQNTAKPTEKDEHATKNHFSSQFGYEMCIKYITLFPDNVEVQKVAFMQIICEFYQINICTFIGDVLGHIEHFALSFNNQEYDYDFQCYP